MRNEVTQEQVTSSSIRFGRIGREIPNRTSDRSPSGRAKSRRGSTKNKRSNRPARRSKNSARRTSKAIEQKIKQKSNHKTFDQNNYTYLYVNNNNSYFLLKIRCSLLWKRPRDQSRDFDINRDADRHVVAEGQPERSRERERGARLGNRQPLHRGYRDVRSRGA